MKTSLKLTSGLLASLVLTACGSSGSGPSPGASVAAHKAAVASLPSSASAEQVAEHLRGDVHCPANLPAVAAGAPVDDIVGVRPGLSYEAAANAVMCSNPLLVINPDNDRGFNINTYGQTIRQGFNARLAQPRVEKTGKQIMDEMNQEWLDRENNAVRRDLKPGEQKWFVSTMGMPGKEAVIDAARELWFAKDKNPTVDSITAELIKKYGTPSETTENCANISTSAPCRALRWAYDPRGRLITETSPLFGACGTFTDPDQGVNLSPNCGIVVAAAIARSPSNPALAQYMQVRVVDQAAGYALLTSTEDGLKALDAARRAKEVNAAANNAPAVSM